MITEAEARKVIDTIREECGLTSSNETLLASFDRMSKIFSSQLYDNATHFVLELLQNADDNTYESKTPCIKFTYTPGYLRVDCNEVGFNEANVRAISDFAASTKSERNKLHGYTGEKGIGFKSVFKVADVVWIKSGPFSFKFDRHKRLGMRAPENDVFPVAPLAGHTSFYFQLSTSYEQQELLADLNNFDPDRLLFLRRLEVIEIDVQQPDRQTCVTRLTRSKQVNAGYEYTTIKRGIEQFKYYKIKYMVNGMPSDSNRPDFATSELEIAIPAINSTGPAVNATRDLYAYLPIKNYGLKFVLQGDFLLTASRGAVDVSSRWNQALRDNLVSAFLIAVQKLNHDYLKYHWLYYLPDEHIDPFFESTRTTLLATLASRECLEGYDGSMRRPTTVFRVPQRFLDEGGVPFSLSPETSSKYLSPHYPTWTMRALIDLGVLDLTPKMFLEDLGSIIAQDQNWFKNQPRHWHESLCQALARLTGDKKLADTISEMPLIPTTDGSWIAASDEPVFLAQDISIDEVPLGDMIPIIDPKIVANHDRRRFFETLGVKSMDSTNLCTYICIAHTADDCQPEDWTVEQLVAQTSFLFKHSFRPPSDADMWFATTENERCRGSCLYLIDSDTNTSAYNMVVQLKGHFPVLHPAYLSTESHDWRSFLTGSLRLATIPHLVTFVEDATSSFSLSDEFKHLFRVFDASQVLGFILEHWQQYSPWLESDSDKAAISSKKLLKTIAGLEVPTSSGNFQLGSGILDNLDAMLQSKDVPILKFEKNLSDLQKQRLARFGIAVELGVKYYLSCLEYLSHQWQPDKGVIAYLYEQIQDRYDGNEDTIGSAFRSRGLIYIVTDSRKPGQATTWLTIGECAQRKYDPSSAFPLCKSLFNFLMLNTADAITRLTARLRNVNMADKLQTILNLFYEIDEALSGLNKGKEAQFIKNIQDLAIIPVTRSSTDDSFECLVTLQSSGWLIADRPHLKDSFSGKVPLLAINPRQIHDLQKLVETFKLEPRRLSKCTTIKDGVRGKAVVSLSHTGFIRARVDFLLALIPRNMKDYVQCAKRVKGITINKATQIVQPITAKYGEKEYSGRPIPSEIAATVDGGCLQLHVLGRDLVAEMPPLSLARLIADHCGIADPTRLALLSSVLAEPDIQRLYHTFIREGFFIDIDIESAKAAQAASSNASTEAKSEEDKYLGTSGDIYTIPSPYGFKKEETDDNEQFQQFGTRHASSQRKKEANAKRKGRQIPLLTLVDTSDENFVLKQGVVVKNDDLDQSHDLQFLGELMVHEFFKHKLPGTYNASRWTSVLKSRAGLPTSGVHVNESSFSFMDRHSSAVFTDFLIASGHPDSKRWRHFHPRYHIEVMVSPTQELEPFVWDSKRLDRARRYHLFDRCIAKVNDILVVIQITTVYTRPKFHLLIDPWSLVKTQQLILHGNHKLQASIAANAHRPIFSSNLKFATKRSHPYDRTPDNHMFVQFPQHIENWNTSAAQRFNQVQPWQNADWRKPRNMDAASIDIPAQARSDVPITKEKLPQPHHRELGSNIPGQNALGVSKSNQEPQSVTNGVRTPNQPQQYHEKQSTALTGSIGGPQEGRNRQSVNRDAKPATASQQNFVSYQAGQVPALTALLGTAINTEETYRYRRLTEDYIRLFVLFPAAKHEPLRGALYCAPLDNPGSYRTLSYVWGADDDGEHFVATSEGQLKVSETLKTILETLRSSQRPVTLWIDAICINQKNAREKCTQICLLPEIFQNAVCTLAYLGAEPDHDVAIETLLQIRAKHILGDKQDVNWPKDLPVVDASWHDLQVPPQDAPLWTNIRALFSKSWFRRAWIVQEMVIAPSIKVVCGKWMVDWQDLLAATELIDQEHQDAPAEVRPWLAFLTLGQHREWEARLKRWPLYLLLENYRHVDSTLARDRFYSLVGLATDGDRDEFIPDYAANFETIALRIAEGMLVEHGMMLLYRAGLQEPMEGGRFPSWVPNWTEPKPNCLANSSMVGAEFNACGDTTPLFNHKPGSDELQVSGFVIGTVSEISVPCANETKARRVFFTEVDKMIESLSTSIKKSEREEWKWQVPIAGAEHIPDGPFQQASLEESYTAYRRWQKTKRESALKQSDAYTSLLNSRSLNWRFALIGKDRCALLPSNAQLNDVICILKGGAVPFVIRSGARTDCYRLIGECYVAGVMHGQESEQLLKSARTLTIY